MDGSLNLIGHNGLLRFSVPAHSKPISILRCHGDKVITGGYDGVVMVHRLSDMACVNSVFVHKGHITALTIVEVRLHPSTYPYNFVEPIARDCRISRFVKSAESHQLKVYNPTILFSPQTLIIMIKTGPIHRQNLGNG